MQTRAITQNNIADNKRNARQMRDKFNRVAFIGQTDDGCGDC